jgi:hypothetical protein
LNIFGHKILDAEYEGASLDYFINTSKNLHVEEQDQLKTLHQKYENLFDVTLREFNLQPISLQLMDLNYKPVHERTYTVPISVEQQLRKEIVRLVDRQTH